MESVESLESTACYAKRTSFDSIDSTDTIDSKDSEKTIWRNSVNYGVITSGDLVVARNYYRRD